MYNNVCCRVNNLNTLFLLRSIFKMLINNKVCASSSEKFSFYNNVSLKCLKDNMLLLFFNQKLYNFHTKSIMMTSITRKSLTHKRQTIVLSQIFLYNIVFSQMFFPLRSLSLQTFSHSTQYYCWCFYRKMKTF